METHPLLLLWPPGMRRADAAAPEGAATACPACRGVGGSGRYIRFLTLGGVLWRFATARRRRGRFVPEGPAAGYQRLAGQDARQ